MSVKERKRFLVFERVKEGQFGLGAAAERLGISCRQCTRSYGRYLRDGVKGLLHRSRGRPSNRAKPSAFRSEVLRLYEEKYDGAGPTYAAEKLDEIDGLVLDHETLRRWLLRAGLWKKSRRRKKHCTWRERKAHSGELVQLDGSHHNWFGGGRPRACLMNMVDDATGTTLSIMAEEETTEAAMRVLWLWIERYGVPKALYTDKKSVFVTGREPTIEEQLLDVEPMTAFGKACEKLGIEIIAANSPQAKGRVERNHGVYQDRLVKDLALEGVSTIEGANRFLRGGFVDKLNTKFAKEPKEKKDYHRPVPKGMMLDEVFSIEETRVVMNDWTIIHNRRLMQILKDNRPLPRPKDKVIVRTLLDGKMQLLYRGRKLKFEPITPSGLPSAKSAKREAAASVTSHPKACVTTLKKSKTPSKTHPWRQNYKLIWGGER